MRFNKILKLTLTTLLLTLLGSFSTTSNASSADDPKLWRSLIPSWVTESLEKHQDLTIELLLTRDYNTFIGKEGQYTELPADFFSAIKFFGVYRLNRLHGTPLELLDPFLSLSLIHI